MRYVDGDVLPAPKNNVPRSANIGDMAAPRFAGARNPQWAVAMGGPSRTRIRVTRRFRAPPARVFDAWLDPQTAGLWLFATALQPMARVKIDARVGGSFCFAGRRDGADIEHNGEYVEIAWPRRLVFTLCANHRAPEITRVTAEIVPLKTGCELILTHENLLADYARGMKARWTGILYGLGVMLARMDTRQHPKRE